MRHSERPQPALGQAIRQLREKRGATQEQLAQSARIAGPTLSLIERGHANPTWATVRDIAAALGISVSALAKAAERMEAKP
jgi:transcriptional regulator with XRE-family HTH domain